VILGAFQLHTQATLCNTVSTSVKKSISVCLIYTSGHCYTVSPVYVVGKHPISLNITMSLNTILNDSKEKSTNKITIKCQITIGTTNSQRVRGVTSTQYSLKRERFSCVRSWKAIVILRNLMKIDGYR